MRFSTSGNSIHLSQAETKSSLNDRFFSSSSDDDLLGKPSRCALLMRRLAMKNSEWSALCLVCKSDTQRHFTKEIIWNKHYYSSPPTHRGILLGRIANDSKCGLVNFDDNALDALWTPGHQFWMLAQQAHQALNDKIIKHCNEEEEKVL